MDATNTMTPEQRFCAAMDAVDPLSADQEQFVQLARSLAAMLELNPHNVLTLVVPGAPAARPMLEERVGAACRLLAVIVPQADEADAVEQALWRHMSQNKHPDAAMICTRSPYDAWAVPAVVCQGNDGLGARIRDSLAPAARIVSPAAGASTHGRPGIAPRTPIVMDDRAMRMLKLSVASSSAVLLVGPPGTGKTTLLGELIADVAHNPSAYGLSRPPREPKWVTPADNWTSTDLVGGETVDEKGRRRFRLGHVMEAIRADRWLVLDETNRANMDRIFGGLLTWLSDQRVELGRASTDVAAPPIVLDWNPRPQCETVRLELLEADKIVSSEPIKLLAGTEWRLLGTYNAQDACKVFSFGQALGRRFAQVPIPAIAPAQFKRALAPAVRGLPEDVVHLIVQLYGVHHSVPRAQLGPAIFLKIAAYVSAGAALPQLAQTDNTPSGDDPMVQMVAEAYLSAAGPWLAKLAPDDLHAVAAAVRKTALPERQWEWITSMMPTLA